MTAITLREQLITLPYQELEAPLTEDECVEEERAFLQCQRAGLEIQIELEEEELWEGERDLDKLISRLNRVNKLVSDISFWTPVAYAEEVPFFSVEGLRQCVDAYFWLCSPTVAVVESLKRPDIVVLKSEKQACWKIALKVASFIVLFLPLLAAKCILRCGQPFFIQKDRWICAPVPGVCASEAAQTARLHRLERDKEIRKALFA